MSGWFVLAFGLLLVGAGVSGIAGERRAARRGRREFRQDLVASVALLFVLGGLAVLLGLAMLFVFPKT